MNCSGRTRTVRYAKDEQEYKLGHHIHHSLIKGAARAYMLPYLVMLLRTLVYGPENCEGSSQSDGPSSLGMMFFVNSGWQYGSDVKSQNPQGQRQGPPPNTQSRPLKGWELKVSQGN